MQGKLLRRQGIIDKVKRGRFSNAFRPEQQARLGVESELFENRIGFKRAIVIKESSFVRGAQVLDERIVRPTQIRQELFLRSEYVFVHARATQDTVNPPGRS